MKNGAAAADKLLLGSFNSRPVSHTCSSYAAPQSMKVNPFFHGSLIIIQLIGLDY